MERRQKQYTSALLRTIRNIHWLLSKPCLLPNHFQQILLEKFKNEYESDKRRKGYPRDGHGSIEDWYTGKKTIEEVRAAQALGKIRAMRLS